jgi:outer membrane protein assembly factor BamB
MAILIKQISGLQSELNGKQPFDANIVIDADYNQFSMLEKTKLANLREKTANAESTDFKQLQKDDDYVQIITPTVAECVIRLPSLLPEDICEFEIINTSDGTNAIALQEYDESLVVRLSKTEGARTVYCYWKDNTWHVWKRGYYGGVSDSDTFIFTCPVITVAALDIDCSLGNYFIKTISSDSTFTFSNPPPSEIAYAFTLRLTHTSGNITWPASVKWKSNLAPTLTTGKIHLFIFVTDDGGANWWGNALVDYGNGEEPLTGSYWIATLESAGDERGYNTTTDNSGNTYVCGYTDSQTAGSGSEALITKYDSSGNILWQKILGGTGIEEGHGIATDNSNNVYFCGRTSSALSFSGTFVVKYSTDGLILWQKLLFRDNGVVIGEDIAIDNNDNVYICGHTQLQGVLPAAFVVKYNASGNILWQRVLGEGDGGTYIWDSIASDNNSVYLCGYGTISNVYNIMLAKYDANGHILWQRTLGGEGIDSGSGVAIDNDGNVYVTGTNADDDLVIAKYDTNGTILWQRKLSGAGAVNDGGRDIAVDSSGNAYVCGYTAIQDTGYILIAKYDANGNILWQRTLGGNIDDESGEGITLDNNNNLCISGYIYGLTGASSVLIAKLPNNGSLTGVYGNFTYAQATLTPASSTLPDSALTLTLTTNAFQSESYNFTHTTSTLTSTTTQLNS